MLRPRVGVNVLVHSAHVSGTDLCRKPPGELFESEGIGLRMRHPVSLSPLPRCHRIRLFPQTKLRCTSFPLECNQLGILQVLSVDPGHTALDLLRVHIESVQLRDIRDGPAVPIQVVPLRHVRLMYAGLTRTRTGQSPSPFGRGRLSRCLRSVRCDRPPESHAVPLGKH